MCQIGSWEHDEYVQQTRRLANQGQRNNYREMNFWNCPISTCDENGLRRGERKCIFPVESDTWDLNILDSVEYGTINVHKGTFPNNWLRVSRHGYNSESARWIKVTSTGTRGRFQMSSSTLWNCFRVKATSDSILLEVSFAVLPIYLACSPAPVESTNVLCLRLLTDNTTNEALLHPNLSEMIEHSLRREPIKTVLQEGISLWITLDALGVSQVPTQIPVVIEKLPVERYVDTLTCRIQINVNPCFSELQPRFEALKDLEADILQRISVTNHRSPFIFGLSGSFRAGKDIIRRVCQRVGILLLPFPIEDLTKITFFPRQVVWYLSLNKISRHAYSLLRKVSFLEPKEPCKVFIMLNGEFDDSFKKLLIKVWKIPELSAAEWQHISHRLHISDEDRMSTTGLDMACIESAVSLSKLESKSFSSSIKMIRKQMTVRGSATIPQVNWESVAGLEQAKNMLIDTFQTLLFESHRLPLRLGRRCGILFYGPPGTGKTMLAKAVATEFHLSFFSIKGPELLDIYVGESEAHIRDVFTQAKTCRPCVLFFDELDSIAVARGKDGDSGGVTDRLVSQLITEIDALTLDEDGQGIFMIGATNRPDLLDPSLLRPGRFDKRIYLGVPQSSAEQVAILRASSSSYLLGVDVNFESLAESLPKTLSPADLASICHSAMKLALGKVIKRSRELQSSLLSDQPVSIGFDDLIEAASIVKPSISAKQIEMYSQGDKVM